MNHAKTRRREERPMDPATGSAARGESPSLKQFLRVDLGLPSDPLASAADSIATLRKRVQDQPGRDESLPTHGRTQRTSTSPPRHNRSIPQSVLDAPSPDLNRTHQGLPTRAVWTSSTPPHGPKSECHMSGRDHVAPLGCIAPRFASFHQGWYWTGNRPGFTRTRSKCTRSRLKCRRTRIECTRDWLECTSSWFE